MEDLTMKEQLEDLFKSGLNIVSTDELAEMWLNILSAIAVGKNVNIHGKFSNFSFGRTGRDYAVAIIGKVFKHTDDSIFEILKNIIRHLKKEVDLHDLYFRGKIPDGEKIIDF
jgi:hypothetical protein